MTTNTTTRAGQVRVKITQSGATHQFVSQITRATVKDNYMVIYASQNAFSPFRIYSLDVKVALGATPGTYTLDGQAGNIVGLIYLPPDTNFLNYYQDISGEFRLKENASLQQVEGSFDCTVKSVGSGGEEAELTEGEVTFSQSLDTDTKGYLRGTVDPDGYTFDSTILSMQFVEPKNHPHFLEVLAVTDKHGDKRVYLHIPKSKLGETSLPITNNENGESAIATLLFAGVHRATEGTVTYTYDADSQRLSGQLSFKALVPGQPTVQFENGKFDIAGLTPTAS